MQLTINRYSKLTQIWRVVISFNPVSLLWTTLNMQAMMLLKLTDKQVSKVPTSESLARLYFSRFLRR